MDSTEQKYGFHPANTLVAPHAPPSEDIKRKAISLGADLVGICEINPELMISEAAVTNRGDGIAFSHVISLGIYMDRDAFRESPSQAIRSATREGYRRMKETASALADHIASLGHNAFSTGNGEADSVALAVMANMGKLGRNGMLLAQQNGPCLRLCKVFTDMPLEVTPTPTDVLDPRCESCAICSEACPAQAIESGAAPAGERWQIDTKRCRKHWNSAQQGCAACISSCPATWQAGSTDR